MKPLNRKKAVKRSRPHCGLCGNTEGLTKTACCDNWICDDEDQYRLFSFARNSCYRNHRRFTLCGSHYTQGHEGHWQDCQECRDDILPEMYVDLGTNPYNFETLRDLPSFEPTHCGNCGRVIHMAREAFSMGAEGYRCERCTHEKFKGVTDTEMPPKPSGGKKSKTWSLRKDSEK